MRANNITHVKSREAGFSLISMCIIMIIGGIMMVPLYSAITNTIALKSNSDKMEMIRFGLAEHLRVFGDLPCPADPTLPVTSPDYGVGDCVSTNISGDMLISVGSVPVDDLARAMDCSTRTDQAANALPDNIQAIMRRSLETFNDMIRAGGGAPADALDTNLDSSGRTQTEVNCIRQDHIIDAYGNKFLYAVGWPATETSSIDYDPSFRSDDMRLIQITQDRFDAMGNVIGTEVIRAPFILLSHGEDEYGAFDGTTGNQRFPCAARPTLDVDNCDRIDGLFQNRQYSNSGGATHFDDENIEFSLDSMMKEFDFTQIQRLTDPMAGPNFNIQFDTNAGTRRVIIGDRINLLDVTDVPRGLIVQNTTAGDGIRATTDILVRGSLINPANGNVDANSNITAGIDVTAGRRVSAGNNVVGENVSAGSGSFLSPRFCYSSGMTDECR